jgi:hypothetical protein
MAVSAPNIQAVAACSVEKPDVIEKLNTTWHKPALLTFMAIVIGHWGEHLFQAYQIYVLHWPRPKTLGMLGLVYPWMVRTETLHYGYALIMLIGLWVLRKGFTGVSHTWWMIAFWIQFWHHIEHALLQYQALTQGRERSRGCFCRGYPGNARRWLTMDLLFLSSSIRQSGRTLSLSGLILTSAQERSL